jgi:hypothetical protein
MGEIERRRRRLRPGPSAAPVPAPPPAGPPPVAPALDTVTPAVEDPVRPVAPARPPRGRPTSGAGAGGDDRETERGLRGLVGSGSSQVSVGAALRARDAARPTDAHLADAEANLTIVHRNWMPREDLPRNR